MIDVITRDVKAISGTLKEAGIDFSDREVLITGGAGFLGSWACDVLLDHGARVTCLDNLASGLRENISHLEGSTGFTFVEHDISRPIEFDNRFDMIVHMASRASPFEFSEFPIEILKANTLGIWVALGIAKRHGARFLYTSTSEVYGDPDPAHVPTPESYNGNVNPVGPRSCYDEAKRAGEAFVMAYRLEHCMDTRMVRIFNTYGPRMRADDIYGRVVPRFIEQALAGESMTVFGDGTQTRSFTYVADEVEGILRLLGVEKTPEVVNIGNDREISVMALAEAVKGITNSKSRVVYQPLPLDDPKRRCPDITLARKALGWSPGTSLEEGLQKMISWQGKSEIYQ